MSDPRREVVENWQRENVANAILFVLGLCDGDENSQDRANALQAAEDAIQNLASTLSDSALAAIDATPGPTDGLRETATVALEAALDKYGHLEQADGERRRYTLWEEFLPRMGLLIARAITAAHPPATPGPVAVSEAAVDTALADYAKKYRRYHNEQERWFDNGRNGEEVPRLDRLLDDVNAARTRVVDLLAARTAARAEPTEPTDAEALSLLRSWVDGEIDVLTKRFLTPHECRELTGARLAAFGEFRACIREVADQIAVWKAEQEAGDAAE